MQILCQYNRLRKTSMPIKKVDVLICPSINDGYSQHINKKSAKFDSDPNTKDIRCKKADKTRFLHGACVIMGHVIRRWWWGGDPDEANQVSGLTLRQVYQVQSTWQSVHAEAGKYGMELFIRLFRADPETKTFFKAIRDADEERIRNSFQFKAHAINFMSAINLAVTNLKQPEIVVAMMNKLGESHGKRIISTKHFYVTKDVLVGMLKNDLKLSEEQMKAWDRFISFIYKNILNKL